MDVPFEERVTQTSQHTRDTRATNWLLTFKKKNETLLTKSLSLLRKSHLVVLYIIGFPLLGLARPSLNEGFSEATYIPSSQHIDHLAYYHTLSLT